MYLPAENAVEMTRMRGSGVPGGLKGDETTAAVVDLNQAMMETEEESYMNISSLR